MVNEEARRIVLKRKLRRLIRDAEILLLYAPHTLAEHHEASELEIEKIKFQLELNSLLYDEAKDAGERKRIEEEKKALQASLADELQNGLELIGWLVEDFKRYGMNDRAEELEILRDVRESELEEIRGKEEAKTDLSS